MGIYYQWEYLFFSIIVIIIIAVVGQFSPLV